MEYDKIKQLMEDMGNSKLSAIDIEFPDGTKVKMEKKEEKVVVAQTLTEPVAVKTIEENKIAEEKKEEPKRNIVKSPMIGTFYSKPSPTSENYVEVGSTVKKGTVLCIIEAMKLMNEIESEYEGKIEEIFVKDGEAVDYGKPLFRIV